MKITVPYVASQEVGVRVSSSADRYFHAADRPNVYGKSVETPIVEFALAGAVVFDKDLRVAARAKAVAGLVLLTVIAPVVIVGATAARIGVGLYEVCVETARDFPDLLTLFGDAYADLTKAAIR